MSTLTLVHATSARLHGQLLGGSHVWRSMKMAVMQVATLQAGSCAHNTRRASKGEARSEGQGRAMAVKRSRANGEGGGREVLGKCSMGRGGSDSVVGRRLLSPGGNGAEDVEEPWE